MTVNRSRVTIYIKEPYRDKYDDILTYMGKLENGSVQNASEAIFEALMAFHQIFIESQPIEVDFITRMKQIEEIIPKDSSEILNQLEIIKNKNDLILSEISSLIEKIETNPHLMIGTHQDDQTSTTAVPKKMSFVVNADVDQLENIEMKLEVIQNEKN